MNKKRIEVVIDSMSEKGIDRKWFEDVETAGNNRFKSYKKKIIRRLNLWLQNNEDLLLDLMIVGISIIDLTIQQKKWRWERERKVLEVQIFLFRCLQLIIFFQRKNKDVGMLIIMKGGFARSGIIGIVEKLKNCD